VVFLSVGECICPSSLLYSNFTWGSTWFERKWLWNCKSSCKVLF